MHDTLSEAGIYIYIYIYIYMDSGRGFQNGFGGFEMDSGRFKVGSGRGFQDGFGGVSIWVRGFYDGSGALKIGS